MQILIVSDSPEQVGALRALALDAGLKQVEGFNHPAAALDWCAGNEPDLVLVDHMMRACDGLEFSAPPAPCRTWATCAFVLMLPAPLPGLGPVRALAWKLGAADFLTTPVDDTEFVARVRNLLLLRSAPRSGRARRCRAFRPGRWKTGGAKPTGRMRHPPITARLAQFH